MPPPAPIPTRTSNSSAAARRPWFRSRRSRAFLALATLLAIFVALFDATWLRPLIQHHIQERSGRRIDFDELRIGLDAALQPTVRLRNFTVQNAPWAARAQPLVRAGEFGFTLAWRSFVGERIVVTRLDLIDAEIDLEHRADGLRNWRVTRPDDRGPGRVRVQAIEARNARAHVIDEAHHLDLDLQVALAAPAVLPGHADMPLVRHIALQGTRDGAPFEGELAVSLLPTFFDTGRAFALRGELRAGAGPGHSSRAAWPT